MVVSTSILPDPRPVVAPTVMRRFVRRAHALFAACPERPGLCEDCRRAALLLGPSSVA